MEKTRDSQHRQYEAGEGMEVSSEGIGEEKKREGERKDGDEEEEEQWFSPLELPYILATSRALKSMSESMAKLFAGSEIQEDDHIMRGPAGLTIRSTKIISSS